MEAAVGRGRFSIVYDSNEGSQYREVIKRPSRSSKES